ncbi:unnamed protein product, partial [Mesorhabditis belari]|uniref:Uncharacterized protein n=1 Tax=Mesorhabditis belari TaxID=2138241 RepID=A0AAF3EVN0_9BILA
MLDKDVAFKLSDNQITESSIKHAFLLPPDAIVKLSYQENGQQIDCRVNEVNEATFLLPDGWSSMQFHVESDQAPSRPSTPADQAQFLDYKRDPESPYVIDEKLASELCNRLFFAPRGQQALRGPDEETFAVKDGVIDGGCVSPISPRAAVTFAHKSHTFLREYAEGQDDERNQHSLVEIRNCQNQNIRHIMKVIVVDAHHDFVLLFSLDGTTIFEDYPHALHASSNPADTWISPGELIWGAYQKYLVQHGFFQPRGERELGGSKSKRPRLEPSPK